MCAMHIRNSLLKRSSGRIQRRANREAYFRGQREVLSAWSAPSVAIDPAVERHQGMVGETSDHLEAVPGRGSAAQGVPGVNIFCTAR